MADRWVKKPTKTLSIEKINWKLLFKIRHMVGDMNADMVLC